MLTVPQSNALPGRAPQAPKLQTPEIGQALAQLGSGLEGMASRLIEHRIQTQAQADSLDMTTDFQQARLQVDQIGDPAQVGPAWDQATAGIAAKWFGQDGKGADGQPIDPRLNDARILAFNDLKAQHTNAIAGQIEATQQSTVRAGWMQTRARIESQSVTADPTTADALLTNGLAQIDGMEQAGILSPEDAAAQRIGLTSDVNAAKAGQLIATDPQAFLDQASKGQWNGISADRLAQLQKSAQDQLGRQAAHAGAYADDQLKAMIGLSKDGISPAQRGLLADPAFRAAADPALLAQADAAVQLVDELPTVGQMSLPELDQAIAAERAAPKTDTWQTQKLDLLTQRRAAKFAGLTKDPAAWAQAEGQGFDPLPAFDPANPKAYASALKARTVDAGVLSKREGIAAEPLTQAEQDQIKAMAGPDADPKTRAQLAAVLGATLGMTEAAKITGDQTFAWGAGLASNGGSPAVVADMMRGQSRIKADNIVLPPVASRLAEGFNEMGNLVADMGGNALQSQIWGAADALYAARIGSPTAAFDPNLYKQALHEVLGGTGAYGGSAARGGIQDVRGTKTVLPSGVAAAAVETALDAMPQDPAKLAQMLGKLAFQGAPPTIMGKPVTADDLSQMSIEAVGNDLYQFVTPNGDTLADAGGTVFRFMLMGDAQHPGLLTGIQP